MKLRRAVVASFAVLSMGFAIASAGCSRRAPAAPERIGRTTAEPSPPFESSAPAPSWVERRAQKTWCAYLEALYHRATLDGSSWTDRERCDADSSTAAPEMLERTADCSKRALDAFQGDPFTDGYAAEVKRCGVTILDAMALPETEAEPYAALVCARAARCGAASDPCSGAGGALLRRRLGRALGAINGESKAALRRCLQKASCQEAGTEVSTCLDPILDRLLWTPG